MLPREIIIATEKLASIQRKICEVIEETGEGKVIVHIKHSEVSGATKVIDERYSDKI